MAVPSHSWPLWALTGLLLIAFPALNFVYWPQILRSGVLPTEADSIGILMFGSVLSTIVFSPFIIGISWFCLRRYNPEARLAAWRNDRLLRSALATILFGGAALFTLDIIGEAGLSQPWYEYLWPAYFLLWLPWLIGLRAAVIDQLDGERAVQL